MGKGSYRGGSTLVGWNANQFVAPTNRQSGKAKTPKVAETREEAAAMNTRVRAKLGRLRKSKKPKAPLPPLLSPAQQAEAAAASEVEKLRKQLVSKRKATGPLAVIVEKRKTGTKRPG